MATTRPARDMQREMGREREREKRLRLFAYNGLLADWHTYAGLGKLQRRVESLMLICLMGLTGPSLACRKNCVFAIHLLVLETTSG